MSYATLHEAFWTLLDPWLFMWLSAKHIPSTIFTLIQTGALSSLLSPSAFREALFGNFWATAGPQVRANAGERVVPLLQGRVSNGKVSDTVVNRPVDGVVIEVGAGSGMWADVFREIGALETDAAGPEPVRRRKADAGRETIDKIYGVEPNPQSHRALQKRVAELGMGGVYQVVPVGIEDITDPSRWEGKIEPGSVDCIVSILCLCSIPDEKENCRRLYELLKPGGRWYVYEHVRHDGLLMKLYQRFVNFFWSFFLGSCRLCKPTGHVLRNVGPWSSVDLEPREGASEFAVLPHVIGVLTK